MFFTAFPLPFLAPVCRFSVVSRFRDRMSFISKTRSDKCFFLFLTIFRDVFICRSSYSKAKENNRRQEKTIWKPGFIVAITNSSNNQQTSGHPAGFASEGLLSNRTIYDLNTELIVYQRSNSLSATLMFVSLRMLPRVSH